MPKRTDIKSILVIGAGPIGFRTPIDARVHGASVSGLEPTDQPVVIGVRAHPEPDHGVILKHTQCAPATSNAHGINGSCLMDAFKAKAGMSRVGSPSFERDSGALLNVGRQGPETGPEALGCPRLQTPLPNSSGVVLPARNSASASSASSASSSWDSLNAATQRSSDSTSSRRIAAMASCSPSGSLSIVLETFFHSFVMSGSLSQRTAQRKNALSFGLGTHSVAAMALPAAHA